MAENKKDLDSIKKVFFDESRELLRKMEKSLLDLEKNYKDTEAINSVFRAIHTTKGSAGMFGFDEIENFTHAVENLLDIVRKGELTIDHDMIEVFLDCHDFTLKLLDLFENEKNPEINEELKIEEDELFDTLNSYLSDTESGIDIKTGCYGPEEERTSYINHEWWHISLRFKKNTFRNCLDPEAFISYLNKKGDIVHIATIYDSFPQVSNFNPEDCYLGFEIDFTCVSTITKIQIERYFEFVSDDCTIRILPPGCEISDYVKLINELPETPMRIGEILKEIGTLTDNELREILQLQEEDRNIETDLAEVKPVGEILVEEKIVHQDVVDAALNKQRTFRKIDPRKSQTIRIGAEKLDSLINLVGELVITSANVKQLAGKNDDAELNGSVSILSRLIEEMRDNTLSIRMVQIGDTFKRFERVVRDLCRDGGKNAELIIYGGETELDKTLIEKISDPLMHLVRNAIDHGIDTPEERIAQGKPEVAQIILNAYHEAGSIVIEISDDGSGLDHDRIFEQGVKRGLLTPGQEVTDEELFQMIFESGFSTAEKITNISGRGVGMDVVRRNIESLRGSVAITSEKGEGTIVQIHLPLTLAIIDGFLVQVGDSSYVIPLNTITECTKVKNSKLLDDGAGAFTNLRGDVLPFLRLREFFDEEGSDPDQVYIVVIEYANNKAGIVVDTLHGEFQTVVKPLGKLFSPLRWISGSTILGNGEVALILDVPKLISRVQTSDSVFTKV